jgi:hypothetical protein
MKCFPIIIYISRIVLDNDIKLIVEEEASTFVETDAGQLTDSSNHENIFDEEEDQDMKILSLLVK